MAAKNKLYMISYWVGRGRGFGELWKHHAASTLKQAKKYARDIRDSTKKGGYGPDSETNHPLVFEVTYGDLSAAQLARMLNQILGYHRWLGRPSLSWTDKHYRRSKGKKILVFTVKIYTLEQFIK